MNYKKIFEIKGTPSQQQIIIDAIDKIYFPWERLTPPNGVFFCGWADLNGQGIYGQGLGRAHIGYHPGDTDAEPIKGMVEGREYTLGVMFPGTGNIFVDNYLTNYPLIAQTTVSAEISHICDYFLPLTDTMKFELNLLAHNGANVPHNHSIWWEVSDYGTEYFNLVAESFMGAFTYAYSDMDFDMSSFTHKFTKEMAPAIRAILGIQRTDYIPPAPLPKYKVLGTSKIYHVLSHYKNPGRLVSDLTGLAPCRICKP